MKDKELLEARYPDLLGEQADADLLALVGDLDAAYSAPEPPAHLTLAGALAERERAPQPRRHALWPRRFQPAIRLPRRVSAVAAALALAVVLTAGSVFAYPLIQHLFDPDPGLTQVVQNPLLYQDVNASQTVDGFTLTVKKAYADANRIIVSYTLTNAADPQSRVSYGADLFTQDGLALRGHAFYYSQNGTPLLAWYDASVITGNPPQLHLRLKTGSIAVKPMSPTPSPQDFLPQPIAVDFSVPFHSGRVVNPHQAVTVHGKTLLLERVVVTPSETRCYLRGVGYGLWLTTNPLLSVGGWNSDQLKAPGNDWSDGIFIWPTDDQEPTQAMMAVNYDTSLFDKHGTWALTLDKISASGVSVTGPWTFHFVVP
jgi:hypothetical protein